jgi:uncharacterized membrane-anchored protein YhcB (DUF1043 family)
MLVLLVTLLVGILAGVLIFRNNQPKIENKLTDAEQEAERLRKAGRYLLDVLKGRDSDRDSDKK